MNKLEELIKNNKIIQKLYIVLGTVFFRFCALFVPIKNNQILFSSMSGNNFEYSSPYYLYLKIKYRFGNKFKYVWAFSKKQPALNYTGDRVKINSFKYFIMVLRSRIWITDVNIERGLRLKRKKQYYVNTWHGGITKGYPKNRKDYNLNNVDIFCSDGKLYDEYFSKYYNVRKSAFLHCGRPREDTIFLCEANRDAIREELNIKKNEFVILYMPTWRENGSVSYLDADYVIKNIPDSRIIFHVHNLDTSNYCFSNKILNFSYTQNLNSLYAAADLIISDFSSCVYDFMLLKKPAVLFARDYDDYAKNRGLAIDFKKEFPNSVAENEEELVGTILRLQQNNQLDSFESFLKKVVDDIDRKKPAVDAIVERMDEEKAFIVD